MTLPRGLLALAVLVLLLGGGAIWWQLRPVLDEPVVAETVAPAAILPAVPVAVSVTAPASAPEPAGVAAAPAASPALAESPALISTPVVTDTSAAAALSTIIDTPAVIETPVTSTPTATSAPIAPPEAIVTPAVTVESPAAVAVQEAPVPIPASLAPVESSPVAPQSGLLLQRTEATQQWLGSVRPDAYMVQMLSVSSAETVYVERFLGELQLAGLLDDTYSCIANSQGRRFWKIVYGSFETVELARNFIVSLPASVLANSPFVQNIGRLECDQALQSGFGD